VVDQDKDRPMYDLNPKRVSPEEMFRTRDLTPGASRRAGMAAVLRDNRLQVRLRETGELEMRMVETDMTRIAA